MSGYRESSFDPNAGAADNGPPLRPYNWVQWAGVLIALIGIAIDLVYLGGRIGIIPKLLDSPSIGVGLPLIGAVLVGSRRAPGKPLSAETKRRNAIIILATLGVCVLVAGAVVYFKGA